MSIAPKTYITPQEYLARERRAEFKSEYYRGEMFAMGGASKEHNRIGVNLTVKLTPQLDEQGCILYANDMRVNVAPTGLYCYPDIVITREKPRFEDHHLDTLLNPRVIFEVLSKTTEAYDRGAKFEQYRTLDSLTDYLLVAQDRHHVEHFEKQADGTWSLRDFNDPAEVIVLTSIGCRLSLADVYLKVDFEKPN